ncbi:MAG: nitrate ABC transporter, permease protein, partial [Dolichospermum sp.]
MILQLNLAAIIAVATRTVWRKAKPIIFQDTFLFPALGCLGIILLWWVVALANHELMPTPPEALIANWDYILHPFYERGPGDLGVG